MSRHLNVAEAKAQFADVLAKVKLTGERVVIQRRGRPLAAIVPLEDLKNLEEVNSGGLLSLVGAFSRTRFADVLDEVVQERTAERSRKVPKFSK